MPPAPTASSRRTGWSGLFGTQTGVQSNHKHKHRGHKLHIKPGKPSGVSPKPGEGGGLIEGEPGVGIKEEGRVRELPGRCLPRP